jgi:hypothetical protein
MEKEFRERPENFNLFSFEDYVEFFIIFLERLNPAIVVERFTGEAPPDFLTEQRWGKRRTEQIVSIIEKRLEELNTWQGRLYGSEKSIKSIKSIKSKDNQTIRQPDNQTTRQPDNQ